MGPCPDLSAKGSALPEAKTTHYYFVDEAGDLTLFGRRGKVLVGTPGCSATFAIGVVHLQDPEAAGIALGRLRRDLLADPYFDGVPSMQAAARKTALYFHAKDDSPEVRREVFRLLPSLGAKVQVIVRRKSALLSLAQILHSSEQRLTANNVYDDMVKRLFRDKLHKADENEIVFARRGKSKRRLALEGSIEKAKKNFEKRWDRSSDKPTVIRSKFPWAAPGLQVIDYYLWALQRLYERGEARYFNLLRPGYRLVVDLDDKRNNDYGEYYNNSNPLGPEKIKAF